jgi:hypothetical protein
MRSVRGLRSAWLLAWIRVSGLSYYAWNCRVGEADGALARAGGEVGDDGYLS